MPNDDSKPHQQLEYLVEQFVSQDKLNDLGKLGWEVVCVMVGVMPEDRVIFKRPRRGRPNA